jgi:hypothetical protein
MKYMVLMYSDPAATEAMSASGRADVARRPPIHDSSVCAAPDRRFRGEVRALPVGVPAARATMRV